SGIYPQDRNNDEIKLINADYLSSYEVNGSLVRKLSGNVYLVRKNVEMKCDTAWYFDDSENYKFSGNVRIFDGKRKLFSSEIFYLVKSNEAKCNKEFKIIENNKILKAKKGKYFYNDRIFEAENNVVYKDLKRELHCDYMKYIEDNGEVFIKGNIRFRDEEERIYGEGEKGKYLVKKEYGLLEGNPLIVVEDTVSGDSIFISGEKMEFLKADDSTSFFVKENVRIKKGVIVAYCSEALYLRESEIAHLTGKPYVTYKDDKLISDEINLYLKGREIYRVESKENAVIYSRADTTGKSDLKNKLEGKSIFMYFTGGVVDSIVARKNAKSLYYIFSDGKMEGANKASGEKIVIKFVNGDLKKILVCNSGEGQFYPPEMIDKVKEDEEKTANPRTDKKIRKKKGGR
ncbi:hypothetical protein DRQ09_03370, partial [candidate division KSB1 bacterium]